MIPSKATPPLPQMILTAAEMSFVWFWAGFHSFLYGGGPELALLIVFITRGSSVLHRTFSTDLDFGWCTSNAHWSECVSWLVKLPPVGLDLSSVCTAASGAAGLLQWEFNVQAQLRRRGF